MKAHYLYAYGTLQVPAIFQHVMGRLIEGQPATLQGYARYRVSARAYPAVVAQAGGCVQGLVYAGLSSRELGRLDAYEGELYERQLLPLSTHSARVDAHVYVFRSDQRHRLSSQPWDLELFTRDHLAQYLERIGVPLGGR